MMLYNLLQEMVSDLEVEEVEVAGVDVVVTH